MNFSLTRKHLNLCCDLPLLFGKTVGTSTSSSAATSIGFNDEGKRIQHYAELLMPLMFETWMEVRPQKFGHEFNEDLVITNEAAFSLKTILEIIERINELICLWDADMNNSDLSDWFRETYNKEFCAQIFVAFPYSQGDGYKGEFQFSFFFFLEINSCKFKGANASRKVYRSNRMFRNLVARSVIRRI